MATWEDTGPASIYVDATFTSPVDATVDTDVELIKNNENTSKSDLNMNDNIAIPVFIFPYNISETNNPFFFKVN